MHSLETAVLDQGLARADVDVFVLKDRLHGLFSHYGQVLRLDLVRADQGSNQRVMCFVRMSTPEQEQAVVDALGLGRFGGDLVMVLALNRSQPASPIWPCRAASDLGQAPRR